MSIRKKVLGHCTAMLCKGMAAAVLSLVVAGGALAWPGGNWQWNNWSAGRDSSWPNGYIDPSGNFHVQTEGHLAQMAWLVNTGTTNFLGKTVYLDKDLDLSNAWWTPIGWYHEDGNGPQANLPPSFTNHVFQGNFIGLGHTIKGLCIHEVMDKRYHTAGLFGMVAGGVVYDPKNRINYVSKPVQISDLNIEVAYFVATKWYSGGLAGYLWGAAVKDVKVSGADPSATLYCVGDLDRPLFEIEKEQFVAYPYKMYAGGIAGKVFDASVYNSGNALPIAIAALDQYKEPYLGNIHTGGIVGEIQNGTGRGENALQVFEVVNCANTGPTYSVPAGTVLGFASGEYGRFNPGDYSVYMGGIAGTVVEEVNFIEGLNDGGLTNTVPRAIIGGIIASYSFDYQHGNGHLLIDVCRNRGGILLCGAQGHAGGGMQPAGGGIAGEINGFKETFVRNCSNIGAVAGAEFATLGGLAGYAYSTTFRNNWSSGDVEHLGIGPSANPIGGLIGCFSLSTVWNCYTSGAALGGNARAAVGQCLGNDIIEYCYWRERKPPAGLTALDDGIGNAGAAYLVSHCGTFGDAPGNFVTVLVAGPAFPFPVQTQSLLNHLNYVVRYILWNPGTLLTWTLDGSYPAGGKGYPVFGAPVATINGYNVDLYPNGGWPTTSRSVTAFYGLPMPTNGLYYTPWWAGYIFAGYTNTAGEAYYDGNLNSVRNWDKEHGDALYAVWVADEVNVDKVFYYGCGGQPGVQVTSCAGGLYVLPPVPAWAGHTFAGWIDSEGNAITAGTAYPSSSGSPHLVYATWEDAPSAQWVQVSGINVFPQMGLTAVFWDPLRLHYPTATYKYTIHVSYDLITWFLYEEGGIIPLGDTWQNLYIHHGSPHHEAQFSTSVLGFPGKAFFKVWAEKQ